MNETRKRRVQDLERRKSVTTPRCNIVEYVHGESSEDTVRRAKALGVSGYFADMPRKRE